MVKIYRKDIFLIILKGLGLGLWCLTPFQVINNISDISWQSILLVEETGVHGKKTTNLPQVTDKLYHIVLYRAHLPEWDSNSQH